MYFINRKIAVRFGSMSSISLLMPLSNGNRGILNSDYSAERKTEIFFLDSTDDCVKLERTLLIDVAAQMLGESRSVPKQNLEDLNRILMNIVREKMEENDTYGLTEAVRFIAPTSISDNVKLLRLHLQTFAIKDLIPIGLTLRHLNEVIMGVSGGVTVGSSGALCCQAYHPGFVAGVAGGCFICGSSTCLYAAARRRPMSWYNRSLRALCCGRDHELQTPSVAHIDRNSQVIALQPISNRNSLSPDFFDVKKQKRLLKKLGISHQDMEEAKTILFNSSNEINGKLMEYINYWKSLMKFCDPKFPHDEELKVAELERSCEQAYQTGANGNVFNDERKRIDDQIKAFEPMCFLDKGKKMVTFLRNL